MQLLSWLAAPRDGCGIHVLNQRWEWEFTSYDEMQRSIVAVSGQLQECGLQQQRVGILADDPLWFLVRFLGSLHARCTAVPIVPASAFQTAQEFQDRLDSLVTTNSVAATFLSNSPTDTMPTILEDGAHSRKGTSQQTDDESNVGLVQFSSGTTGPPKAIRLTRKAIDRNVQMIRDWLQITDQDATATWLPLYHDMGLIGTSLVPIASQSNLYIMTPRQFLRRPDIWLSCFDKQKCTMTASPPFGYLHAARRAREERLRDANFARWRIAIIGAEPIRSSLIREFCGRFEAHGFSRRAFCPAYGMAEATLIVTGVPVDDDIVEISEGTGESGTELESIISSGSPLPGTTVDIRDESNDSLPEGTVGEIVLRSESLADGYGPSADRSRQDSWHHTGDAGISRNGQLYVHGRISDTFKVRGRVVFVAQAEDLILGENPSLRSVVLIPSRRDGVGLTALVDQRKGDVRPAHELAASIAGLFDNLPVDVLSVPARLIPKTTSGKVRRRECWARFVGSAMANVSIQEALT